MDGKTYSRDVTSGHCSGRDGQRTRTDGNIHGHYAVWFRPHGGDRAAGGGGDALEWVQHGVPVERVKFIRFYKRMNSIFGTYEDSPADDAPRSESSPCVCFLLL
jgi:hypothetical protein